MDAVVFLVVWRRRQSWSFGGFQGGGTMMDAPGIHPAPSSTSRPGRNHPRSGRALGFSCPGPWSVSSLRLAGEERLYLSGESRRCGCWEEIYSVVPGTGSHERLATTFFVCTSFFLTQNRLYLSIWRFPHAFSCRFASQSFHSAFMKAESSGDWAANLLQAGIKLVEQKSPKTPRTRVLTFPEVRHFPCYL